MDVVAKGVLNGMANGSITTVSGVTIKAAAVVGGFYATQNPLLYAQSDITLYGLNTYSAVLDNASMNAVMKIAKVDILNIIFLGNFVSN